MDDLQIVKPLVGMAVGMDGEEHPYTIEVGTYPIEEVDRDSICVVDLESFVYLEKTQLDWLVECGACQGSGELYIGSSSWDEPPDWDICSDCEGIGLISQDQHRKQLEQFEQWEREAWEAMYGTDNG